jgi:hypothetical protein
MDGNVWAIRGKESQKSKGKSEMEHALSLSMLHFDLGF